MLRFLATTALAVVVVFSFSAAAQYKYNYKNENGQYNYDVSGYGDDGYYLGNIDTKNKYVSGYVTNENGEEKYFEGEFYDYGRIGGYDEDGNYIDLWVD